MAIIIFSVLIIIQGSNLWYDHVFLVFVLKILSVERLELVQFVTSRESCSCLGREFGNYGRSVRFVSSDCADILRAALALRVTASNVTMIMVVTMAMSIILVSFIDTDSLFRNV